MYIEVSSEGPCQESDSRKEDVEARHTDGWMPADMLQFQAGVNESGKEPVIAVGRVLADRVCEDVPYVRALGRSVDPKSGSPNAPVYQDGSDRQCVEDLRVRAMRRRLGGVLVSQCDWNKLRHVRRLNHIERRLLTCGAKAKASGMAR